MKNRWGWIFTFFFVFCLSGLLFLLRPANLFPPDGIEKGRNVNLDIEKETHKKMLIFVISGLSLDKFKKYEGTGPGPYSSVLYQNRRESDLVQTKMIVPLIPGEQYLPLPFKSMKKKYLYSNYSSEAKQSSQSNIFNNKLIDDFIGLQSFLGDFSFGIDHKMEMLRTFNKFEEPILELGPGKLAQSFFILQEKMKKRKKLATGLPEVSIFHFKSLLDISQRKGLGTEYDDHLKKIMMMIQGSLDFLETDRRSNLLNIMVVGDQGPSLSQDQARVFTQSLGQRGWDPERVGSSIFRLKKAPSYLEWKESKVFEKGLYLKKERHNHYIVGSLKGKAQLILEGDKVRYRQLSGLDPMHLNFDKELFSKSEFIFQSHRGHFPDVSIYLKSLFEGLEDESVFVTSSRPSDWMETPLIVFGPFVDRSKVMSFTKKQRRFVRWPDLYPTLNAFLDKKVDSHKIEGDRDPASAWKENKALNSPWINDLRGEVWDFWP